MIQEDMTAVGRLTIQVISPDGTIKDERKIKNLVVDTGKTFIAASMLKTTSNSPAAMTHMAIGTGSTAAAAGDTALGGEVGTRVTFSPAASNASNVVTYVGTFLPNNPATSTGLYEAGIFNACTANSSPYIYCLTAPIKGYTQDSQGTRANT